MSSFPGRFPHYACTAAKSAHFDFVGSKVYACLGVISHLHFWQNDPSLLRGTAVTKGVERTPNKSQHTKLTLEKKILSPLLSGFELATFQSRVRRSNTLSRLILTRKDCHFRPLLFFLSFFFNFKKIYIYFYFWRGEGGIPGSWSTREELVGVTV